MKQIDFRHIAYHVLVGIYFLWLVVFGILISMAMVNFFERGNHELDRVFTVWILFNLIMGSILFGVIRLFKNRGVLSQIISYTYYSIAAVSILGLVIKALA